MQDKDNFRPYAAVANVTAVLYRLRNRNLPETIDHDLLRIAQVPEKSLSRVMQALRFLELVHEDGRPNDNLVALSAAPEQEYRKLLESILRGAYHADFARINPSEDTHKQIVDAFSPYTPRSQTNRMVILFLGLCREAGIPVLDVPRERKMSGRERGRAPAPTRAATDKTPTVIPTAVFGVTLEDIASLEDNDFKEVWDALGKVVRARARARIARDSIEWELDDESAA